ncbi:MAG: hydroxyacid dehydrogenase [Saprospirales bacterium]|nr:MAG: hydroxyacid dehydrogenase [Saprospirales bacterium]
MKEKVLIADQVNDLLIKGLEDRGYKVIYEPSIEMEEVSKLIVELSGIVVNTRTPIRASLMKAAPKLRWIARLGSGLDIIDLVEADKKGIAVINSPEGNARAVAEHILGMLLALLNNLMIADREIRQGLWLREKNRGVELSGKTVGIIGFGNTGSSFARLLESFECQVLVYDKYKQQYADGYRFVKEILEIQEVLSNSDVVSLHLPLTEETRYLANELFFRSCKSGSIFINSSRGKIVNTKTLLENLKDGWLKGACLDVFENEKPDTFSEQERADFTTLSQMENVVLSPHIAGWTVESKIKIAKTVLKKLDVLKDD